MKKTLFFFFLALLTFLPLITACNNTATDNSTDISDETSTDNEQITPPTELTIAFVPLDQRAVSDLRPVYQVESAGVNIMMPEQYMYRSCLDGMTPNPNGTMFGDREGLLKWMKENEDKCDVFVVSLDQLLSGGLVSSRALTNEDLTLEYEIIDYLISLSERKPLYVFDTVMRLASTVNFNGLQLEEYNAFRSYGQKARKPLSGADLTIEKIYEGYRYDENGTKISTTLTETQLTAYHNSRIRKLKLIDRLLRGSKNIKYCYIGVDDSSPNASIQTNEVNYIKNLIGENGTLFCGTDELGMMSISKAYSDYHNAHTKFKVTYFGGHENEYADSFDFDTLRTNVEKHIKSLGGIVATSNPDLEVLVLTRGCTPSDSYAFVEKWRENEKNSIKTIVIDASNSNQTFDLLLDGIPLKTTMGYSCWGTAGNAMGIALAMGFTRNLYLETEQNKTVSADEAFAKSLVFAFVKDISYCRNARSALKEFTPEAIENNLMREDYSFNAKEMISLLENKEIITDEQGKTYTIPKITLTDFSAPLDRAYEIRFTVNLAQ